MVNVLTRAKIDVGYVDDEIVIFNDTFWVLILLQIVVLRGVL